MDELRLNVGPINGGWRLECAPVQPLHFLSGAKAEAQAHELARRLAATGVGARIAVHDRTGRLVGTARYFAPELDHG